MIRPAAFGFNPATAQSNHFQVDDAHAMGDVHLKARAEFDSMVVVLTEAGIDIRVYDDTRVPLKPDAVFPNNWLTCHEDGTVIMYPMMAENRRQEVRPEIVEDLAKSFGVTRVLDLTDQANQSVFLEGSGSIVFDHSDRVIYACKSARTNHELLAHVGSELGYRPLLFEAIDAKGFPIYHTNVMMSIGESFAVVCLDSIRDEREQALIIDQLNASSKKIIAISYAQMDAFAGNILEVKTTGGKSVILISETAYTSLVPGQLKTLSQFAELVRIEIKTIERHGGGSVRCMVAGIHLPHR